MASKQSVELEEVVKGNIDFTNTIYQELSKDSGNVFFSPISIHAVLAMALQGALGSTAEKIAKTLQVSTAKSAAVGYKDLISRLNAHATNTDVTLLMANKIFLKHDAKLIANFSQSLVTNFYSEVQLIDFAKNEAAAQTINTWVEDKTNNKIRDLIQSDDLSDETRLVLVNAIYFKGKWLNQFDPSLTQIEKFYISEKQTVDVNMMHAQEQFAYKDDEDLDAQILELPYVNENLSMVVILPKKRNGIKELEAKLAKKSFIDVVADMWKTKVNVSLPKFRIEQTIDLNTTLTNVGLGEMFDKQQANFRGMMELAPNENLYVSKVIQKAFIEVNEEGSEAAAATAMVVTFCMMSMPLPPVEFIADHPFLYFLAENRTNILFSGRIEKVTD